MSDTETPQLFWLATIGVTLAISLCPAYCSAEACPYLECNPGYQYVPCDSTFPKGSCEPCPAGHYLADWTSSKFPVPCRPFQDCGEQAKLNCRLNGGHCSSHEPQHCVCHLDKGYFGEYPNCQFRNCPGRTKLSESGDCLPHPSPHPTPSPHPPAGSSTTVHRQPNPKTSSETTSRPSPSTQEGADRKDRENRGDSSHGLGIDKHWILAFGVISGIVFMIILGLVTLIGFIFRSRPRREGSRGGTGDMFHSSGTNLIASSTTSGVSLDTGREDSVQNVPAVSRHGSRHAGQETFPFFPQL